MCFKLLAQGDMNRGGGNYLVSNDANMPLQEIRKKNGEKVRVV
jgi:hypothetical protein